MAGLLLRLLGKALEKTLARLLPRVFNRGRANGQDGPNAAIVSRARRRKLLEKLLAQNLPYARFALLLVGYVWLATLAYSQLGRGTYHDENALQPGQVTVKWGWDDVHAADRYLDSLNALRERNASHAELAQWVKDEFTKLSIPASTQSYAFHTSSGTVNGTNAYAVFPAPRSSGAEAMVISASWLSRIDEGAGTINERGIPTVLALARFLSRYSFWAKDLVFVVGDGYLDGMQAWLNAYHGLAQPNLIAEPLELTSGVIWTALNIDYPGHSFSHIGLFFEGLNGRLPNQDLMNSVASISSYTAGIPIVLHDHIEQPFSLGKHHGKPKWQVNALKELHAYKNRARNILRYFSYEILGRPSGPHGLFHQFRIDAITVYAVPAVGPHGFHSLGKLVESSLRTMNNLLERLHASFFFYLMVGPVSFLKIGLYLPPAILLSIAITITGLGVWTQSGWTDFDEATAEEEYQAVLKDAKAAKEQVIPVKVTKQTFVYSKRRRPVMEPLVIMLITHIIGALVLWASQFPIFVQNFQYNAITLCAAFVGLVLVMPTNRSNGVRRAPFHSVLHAFNLLLAGMVVSLIAVLNYALSASAATILALPLVCVGPHSHRLAKVLLVVLGAPAFVSLDTLKRVVLEYELLRGWFLPFACVVYLPIVLQSWIAACMYL